MTKTIGEEAANNLEWFDRGYAQREEQIIAIIDNRIGTYRQRLSYGELGDLATRINELCSLEREIQEILND